MSRSERAHHSCERRQAVSCVVDERQIAGITMSFRYRKLSLPTIIDSDTANNNIPEYDKLAESEFLTDGDIRNALTKFANKGWLKKTETVKKLKLNVIEMIPAYVVSRSRIESNLIAVE